MRTLMRAVVGGVCAALIVSWTCPAQAQYYRRGWGRGWGGGWGGSTAGGDIARGMGMYYAGLGMYDLNNAEALNIDVQSAMQWNEYLYESQQLFIQKSRARRIAELKQDKATYAAIQDRIHNAPVKSDITNGDALNAILDELTDPKVRRVALRLAVAPVSWDEVREIPFEYASGGVVLSLDRLTREDNWPAVLETEKFAKQREQFRQAVQNALKADQSGKVSGSQVGAVRDAILALREKLEQVTRPDDPNAIRAENFLKGLAGMTQLLQEPKYEEILAALETYPGTTVRDLIAFMEQFNLRFAPAETARQKQIYLDLYGVLDAQKDEILQMVKTNDPKAVALMSVPKAPGNDPTKVFHRHHWNQVLGKWVDDDAPPPPANP